jgi:vancomycin permeability regulator SanA
MTHTPSRLRRKRLVKVALQSLSALVGCFLTAALILVVAGFNDHLGHADVALVLGNKVEIDGQPSARLRARLDTTAALYRQGYFPKIITSGGTGKEGFDESVVMRDYLVAKGVDPAAIFLDGDGVTTMASAVNTREIAGREKFRSVFVITQYFHVPRSRLALKRCGFETVYSAHSPFFEWRDLYSIPREVVGYASYCLRP